MFDYLSFIYPDTNLIIEDDIYRESGDSYKSYFKYDCAPYLKIKGSFDDYLANKTSKSLYNIRRDKRALIKQHEMRMCYFDTCKDLETQAHVLIKLYKLRWQGRSVTSPLLKKDGVRKFMECTNELAICGGAEIAMMYLDGEPTCVSFSVIKDKVYYLYIFVVCTQGHLKKYSLGNVFIYELLERLHEKKFAKIDFMLGDEKYKSYWTQDKENVYYKVVTDKKCFTYPWHLLKCMFAYVRVLLHRNKKFKSVLKTIYFKFNGYRYEY